MLRSYLQLHLFKLFSDKTRSLTVCVHFSPEGLEQENASSSSGGALRGRSAVGRKHRFDLAARTLLARAGETFS